MKKPLIQTLAAITRSYTFFQKATPLTIVMLLGQASPTLAQFCQSPYSEVYGVTQSATSSDIYAFHTPSGASVKFTSAPASFGITSINTAATDYVTKMVYYGDGNKIYAWDALADSHIIVAPDFQNLLTLAGYTGKFVSLSSGGAAVYDGALYVGVDGNTNKAVTPNVVTQDFEIFKVVLSSDGKTAVSVTPLGIKAKSGGDFTTASADDWGDFTISDTGVILALATNRTSTTSGRRFWKFNLLTNTYSFVTNTTENAQLAKSGDGRLWGLRSGNIVEFDANGTIIGTQVTTAVTASDAAECVVGDASVGDRVWADVNGNGLQEIGEPGITGVTVALYRDINKNGIIDVGDPKLGTQVTGTDGLYNFTGLLPHDRAVGVNHNDFIVKVESGIPATYVATTPTQKNADLASATEVFITADFGYRPPTVSISGTIWNDSDNSANNTFTNIKTNAETGTSGTGLAGTGLYAILVGSNGKTIASVAVDANGTYTFTNIIVNQANVTIELSTTAGTPNQTPPTAATFPNWAATSPLTQAAFNIAATAITAKDFGIKPVPTTTPTTPNLRLIKRMTWLNGTPLNDLINDPADPNDDPSLPWIPDYLKGKTGTLITPTDTLPVNPTDRLEYSIYFLSDGQIPATNVLMCDRVPTNSRFDLNGYGQNQGILFTLSGTGTTMTNVPDGDRAQYFAPGVDPTTIYPTLNCGGPNTNGAIVVNLGTVPNAQLPNTPNTYGIIQFRTRIK